MLKLYIIVSTIIVYLTFNIGLANADTNDDCLDEWNNINFDGKNTSIDKKLALWKKHKGKCSTEGIYLYGIARTLVQYKYYLKAKKATNTLLKYKSKHYKEYVLLSVDIDFNIAAHKDKISNKELNEVRKKYINIQKKYPNWYGGYTGLGNLEMGFDNYIKAKKLFLRANKLQQSALAYRGLTIIMDKTRQYKQATNYGDIAYQIDETLFSDKKFMLSLANSFMNIGKNKVGLNLLGILINKNSNAKKDPDVLKLGKVLYQKVNEK